MGLAIYDVEVLVRVAFDDGIEEETYGLQFISTDDLGAEAAHRFAVDSLCLDRQKGAVFYTRALDPRLRSGSHHHRPGFLRDWVGARVLRAAYTLGSPATVVGNWSELGTGTPQDPKS